MHSYDYLFDLALILLSTKVLSMITKRFSLPQVVGALLAGLLMGPAVLNILKETDFIVQVSEIGVIVLMFTAGMETDITELKKSGKASFVIALLGVLVPLVGGTIVAACFNKTPMEGMDTPVFLQNVFIGVILTATSVSITVETLKEMGKMNTEAGNAILGAAIIDDVLGIIALTIVTTAADNSVSLGLVLLKIVAFFILSGVAGYIVYKVFARYQEYYNRDRRRFVVLAFVFCLLLSYCAEMYFGVADITGAFIAGLVISKTPRIQYISEKFEVLSFMMLSPMFFASIGIKVVLPKMDMTIVLFAVILVVVAILTKVVGCGFGARLCGFSNKEAVQIGTGMISRGEVALIVASKGAAVGLMSSSFFGPVVVVVVVTTIITPVLLKLVFREKKQVNATVA